MFGEGFCRAAARVGRWWILSSRVVNTVLVTVLVTLASARVAHAQQRDQREIHAQELFVLGRYPAALEIYGKLYAETNHPTYLRNIGRCYQKMGDPDKAIDSFREYLQHAKNLPADQRDVIEGYIRDMQALKAQHEQSAARPPPRQEPEPPPPPPVKPILRAPAPSPAREADAPVVRPEPARDDGAAESGGGRRVAAYVVGGASLVSLGVGVFFGVQAIQNERDSQQLCPGDPCGGKGLSQNHTARTDARIADFTIGGGLVGAGIATYLFLTSGAPEPKGHESAASRLRLAPEIASDRVGFTARGFW